MTKAQRIKYFREWNAAVKAHGWRMKDGKFAGERQECWASPELNRTYQEIWSLAIGFAQTFGHQLSPDHFRHSCHVAALQVAKSSKKLTNADFDRVTSLFQVLANPGDVATVVRWLNPDAEKRKRMLWWLSNTCEESYVIAVCREKFGTCNWRALGDRELTQLHMTLKNRLKGQKVAA